MATAPRSSSESDPRVFTFSMHQQHNYPSWKPRSSLDVGLADGTGDSEYLQALEDALPKVMHRNPTASSISRALTRSNTISWRLRLTRDGLRARDRLVIELARTTSLPLAIVLAAAMRGRSTTRSPSTPRRSRKQPELARPGPFGLGRGWPGPFELGRPGPFGPGRTCQRFTIRMPISG